MEMKFTVGTRKVSAGSRVNRVKKRLLDLREKRMIDLNDVKVGFASASGLGNWMLEIDTALHILISVASLVYIILKIRQLIKNNKDER